MSIGKRDVLAYLGVTVALVIESVWGRFQ